MRADHGCGFVDDKVIVFGGQTYAHLATDITTDSRCNVAVNLNWDCRRESLNLHYDFHNFCLRYVDRHCGISGLSYRNLDTQRKEAEL